MRKGLIIAVLSTLFVSCGDNIVPPPNENPLATDDAPAWSPDGRWIAYTHMSVTIGDSAYPTGLYLIDTTGNNRKLVIAGPAYNADWSPDGSRIAFNAGEIFTITSAGDSLTQITNVGSAFFPSFSSDGKRIAFDTPYDDPKGSNAIWIINFDGTSLHDISQHGTGEWREPNWDPDGRHILHLRYLSGVLGEEVFVMDTSGQNGIRLTQNTIVDRNPKWSPDGLTIAWTSGDEIWLMRTDGSNQSVLVGGPAASPAWSPNSKQIAFKRINSRGDKIVLWIINVDKTGSKQLTF